MKIRPQFIDDPSTYAFLSMLLGMDLVFRAHWNRVIKSLAAYREITSYAQYHYDRCVEILKRDLNWNEEDVLKLMNRMSIMVHGEWMDCKMEFAKNEFDVPEGSHARKIVAQGGDRPPAHFDV